MAYASDEVRRCWGFAHPLPSLLHLLQRGPALQHPHRQNPPDHNTDIPDETYITQLESSHAFISNACVAAMADALGISSVTDSLAGSILTANPPAAQAHTVTHSQTATPPTSAAPSSPSSQQQTGPAAAADTAARSKAAKEAVWHQVDAVWADEAVKRGVAHAKAGAYEHAFRCYDQALELNPSSTDALVARGAAHANQGQLRAAVADFEAALQQDPGNTNAAKYLEATRRHMAAAGDQQQQQQQQREREAEPRGAHSSRQAQQHRGGALKAVRDVAQQQAARDVHTRDRHGRPGSSSPLRRGRQHQHAVRYDNNSDSRSRSKGRSRGRSRSRDRGRGGSAHGTRGRSRSRERGEGRDRSSSRRRSRQRKRGRSGSSGSSSDDGSTDTSSSSRHGADGSRHLSLLDIQAAINAVRSAKNEHKRSRGSSKKHKKHSRSHGKKQHRKSKRHK